MLGRIAGVAGFDADHGGRKVPTVRRIAGAVPLMPTRLGERHSRPNANAALEMSV